MKKILSLLFIAVVTMESAWGQAKIPVIMVRPGSAWCFNNDCYKIADNQGVEKKIADYQKALENINMLSSITEVEGLLTDEGLLVKNMSGSAELAEEDALEDELSSDEQGNGIAKSSLDQSRERATADIYLDINYEITKTGPKRQISYVLTGRDAYTNEPVCNVTGLGEPSFSATDAQLLREAVVMKMAQLKERLQAHFNQILAMGRLVTIGINVSTDSNVNLETEFSDGSLGRFINKWLNQNAVEHRVQPERSSSTVASYKVRIPLYDLDGLSISAEDFAYRLADVLKAAPYNVKCGVQNRGLGNARIIIKGKK